MRSAPRWVSSLAVLAFAAVALSQEEFDESERFEPQAPPVQTPPVQNPPVKDPTKPYPHDDNDNYDTPPFVNPLQPPPKLDDRNYWERTLRWWENSVFDQIRISGFRNLGYHIQTISGDREAFEFGNYGGQGGRRFTDMGFIRVTGNKVFGTIDFEANIQDSRFTDPQAQRMRLRYTNGPWEAEYGDLFSRLPSANPFVRLGRQVTGVSAGYRLRNFEIRALTSEARGQARTVTIQGTNSAGPYYLQSSQIIRGSESIQIDGEPLVFGQDYTIDYELGSVTFVNRNTLEARIVPPTSTIVATYESFGFNASSGKLEGLGATYTFGPGIRVGVTALQQKTGGSARLSTRVEKFQGFGAPSTPYFLQFEPLETLPIIVRVDGILQLEGIDYRFDEGNPAIFYFNRFMPSTSEIDVIYTPKPTGDVQGDREAVGLDLSVPFAAGKGSFTYASALGRLTNSVSPSEGIAQAASLRYSLGKYTFSTSIRDVPDDFVSIETTSFNRNERSATVSATYNPNERSTLILNHANSSIASRSATGASTTVNRTRFTSTQASYNITPATTNAWPLTLSTGRRTTVTASQDSTVDTLSLGTSRVLGKLTTGFSLDSQKVTGTTRADLLSLVGRFGYVSSNQWVFTAEAALSDIQSNGRKGTGRDYTVTASYRPSDRFMTGFTHNESDAGDLNTLEGFNSGYGSGFDGNGFSSGAVGSIRNAASDGRSTHLNFSWVLTDRMSLDGAFSLFRRTGNISSNSETRAAYMAGTIDLGKGHVARGSLSRSETVFIESPLSSTATTADFQLAGSPPGRFSYSLIGTALLSGGSSEFQQDAFNYRLDLGYQLAPRHTLAFSYDTGTTRGYYPQDDTDIVLGYRYQIWESLAFGVNYRFREVNNLDPLLNSGAYRVSGLSFTLGFNFFR